MVSAAAATLRSAALPQTGIHADTLLIIAGAGVIALSAQVSIALPFTPVPITGQTLSVLLVGASFGALCGGASALLYVALGIVGLPVYADGAHGWSQVTGATGGYLVGFVLAACLTGWLAERRWDRRFSSALGAMLTGNVLIYVVGLVWLAHELDSDLSQTLALGLYPFIPGDIAKLYLGAAALPAAWRVVGRNRPRRGGPWSAGSGRGADFRFSGRDR